MCLGEVALVQAIDSSGALRVQSRGRRTSVSAMLLDDLPVVGEWVVVHSGFALARLTHAEAQDALALRAAVGGSA